MSFPRWFKSRNKGSKRSGRKATRPSVAPRIELLEDRTLLSSNPFSFFPTTSPISVGRSPHFPAVGDFNGDGHFDLAVPNTGSNTISVLLGKKDGSFQAPVNYTTGSGPLAAAVGDFTGDGKLDLAVTNQNNGTVSVLVGNGDGTFQIALPFLVGTLPQAIVAGDFNGDGRADLAIANAGSNTVSLLLSSSIGIFLPAQNVPVGINPTGIAAGDFNNDGRLDLAVTNNGSANASILLGQGNGTFLSGINVNVGTGSEGVAVADFNRDGRPDLVITNNGLGTANVLLGNGDGTFQGVQNVSVGAGPLGVAVADLNGDGRPDLAVVNNTAGTLSILFGNGDGTFQAAQTVAVGLSPVGVAIAYFDANNPFPDVAVVNSGDNTVSVFKNEPPPLSAAKSYTVGANPNSVAVGDFNRDGVADLAIANYNNGGASSVSVLLGNPDGTFRPATNYTTELGSTAVVVADFNKDGFPDLAVTNENSNSVTVLIGQATAPGTFGLPGRIIIGNGPVNIVAGDFDRDGKMDIAVTSIFDNRFTYALGDGNGGFPNVFANSTGPNPFGLATADFNLDGIPDFVVANFEGSAPASVTEYRGFLNALPPPNVFYIPTPDLPVPDGAISVTAGDFNGDNKPDIAVASDLLNTVTVFFNKNQPNDPNGDFDRVNVLTIPTGPHPQSVVTGDFNRDGIPDLAVSTFDTNNTTGTGGSIEIFLGNGNGTFKAPETYAGLGGRLINLAVFKVKGADSLAAVDFDHGQVLSLPNVYPLPHLNDISPGVSVPTDTHPTFVTIGDLNRDGKPDIVEANGINVTVMLGNGDGTFQSARIVDTGGGPVSVAITNLGSSSNLRGVPDAFPDLVVAESTLGTVSVLYGNGDGTFQSAVPEVQGSFTFDGGGSQFPIWTTTADFNRDGLPDLATANRDSHDIGILLGNGAGGTTPPFVWLNYPSLLNIPAVPTGANPLDVLTGDFNRDGLPDMIALTNNRNIVRDVGDVTVFLGNGDGTFKSATHFPTGIKSTAMVLGDFNGDNIPDVVISNSGDPETGLGMDVRILLGKGDGMFSIQQTTYDAGFDHSAIAAGDFNGDGILDLVTTDSINNTMRMLLGNGDGTFRAAITFATGLQPSSITVADVNGDGTPDIIVANAGSNDLTVLLNQPQAVHFSVTVNGPASIAAGLPFTVTVTALNRNNQIDTSYLGTVHFGSSDLGAGLPGDYQFLPSDGGIKTFTITLRKTGVQGLFLNDSVTSFLAGNLSVTVTPGVATRFVFISPPAGVAGQPFTVTVQAQDAFGNAATGYTGTVHFTVSDTAAGVMLPGDYTFTVADQGTHTFTNAVVLITAGTQTITTKDAVAGIISNNPVVISPAAATHLGFTAPTSTTAGFPFTLTVRALDPFNNTATSYTGTVHFTGSDPTGTLPADYTFTAFDAGVHTFSSVILDTAGSQQVMVTDTANASITSSATIVVIAAAASRLRVGAPINTAAGAPFTVTVTAIDSFGNVATTYRGTVSFTSTDSGAAASVPGSYMFTAADSGIHTFTNGFVLATAGSQTITANDPFSFISGTATVQVSPVAAARLNVNSIASTVAGVSFSVTVTALDAFGNIATAYRGTIAFTSSDPQAILPLNYTFTAADNGTHVFNSAVTLKTAGTQTLIAADTVNPSIRGQSVSVGEFLIPSFASGPNGIVSGPDGNLWFTEQSAGRIGRITTGGAVTEFPTLTPNSQPIGITNNSDGTLWFTESGANRIAHVSRIGVFNEFVIPTANSGPAGIVTGPDGRLWFTEGATNKIGAFSPSFGLFSEFSVPTANSQPGAITAGPDGNLWFVETGANKIARVTPAFAFSEFVLPVNNAGPTDIITGPDGNLWFVLANTGQIGRINPNNPNGSITLFATPTANSGPLGITVGPNGNLWFTESRANQIGQITTSGTVTEYSVPTVSSRPAHVATGADGNIWFTENNGNRIGQLALSTVKVTPAAAARFQLTLPVGVTSVTAGVGFGFTVTVLDPYGNVATGYTGTVQLIPPHPPRDSITPASFPFGVGDAGVHTFSNAAFLFTSGTQTITATDTFRGLTGSLAVPVNAAAVTHLGIGVPGVVAAGQIFNVTISALDQFNNVNTAYTGTVQFSVAGAVTVPNSYTFTRADAGIHTFINGMELAKAGNDGVMVFDTVSGFITGNTTVLVTPGPASRFSVVTPANSQANRATNLTVNALDAFGNAVTNYTGTVHFTTTDSAARLPADYTFTAADAGSHFFSFGVILRTAGGQSVTATDVTTASLMGTATMTVNSSSAQSILATGADAGGGPEVRVFDAHTGAIKFDFYPYDTHFTGGVRVAVGDVTGDGVADIITAPGATGGPDIRVFDGKTGLMVDEFFAYSVFFTGGVNIAVADITGDGKAEIITGPDVTGGPDVRVFEGNGALVQEFLPYNAAFTGGVRVAVGDLNADGIPDIITGAGPGGGPQVRAFSGFNLSVLQSFFAYNPLFTGGVYVASGDVDGDGHDDIITGAGAGGGPHVEVFSGANGTLLRSIFAYAAGFSGGVRVGAMDINGDGRADIITGAGPSGGPHVEVFDGATSAVIDSFFAYSPTFLGGVYVGGQ